MDNKDRLRREADNWIERARAEDARRAMEERRERREATATLIIGSFATLLALCGLVYLATKS